jgi:choline dehydrogenase
LSFARGKTNAQPSRLDCGTNAGHPQIVSLNRLFGSVRGHVSTQLSTADVVVVGSGSGGGTVAARLSEDPDCRVVLLEAGSDFPDEATDPPSFYIGGGAISGGLGAGHGSPIPDMDWHYASEPLPSGRRVRLSRGKLMGGSSMTNGCVAVRAKPSDFDGWVTAGAQGWTWETLRPVFETVESELSVRTYPRERWLPAQELLGEACLQIGFRWEDDLNGPDAWDGVYGPWPRNRRLEVRQGSLNTYIRQARPRPNFSIIADALVDRVLLSGARATAVRYLDVDGSAHDLHADRVVLSAGAYGTPAILMRSGIGAADELHALGIDPVVDLPVGRGLMDHPGISFLVSVRPQYAQMGWPAYAAVARGATYWNIPIPVDEEQGLIRFACFLGIVEGIDGSISLHSTDPTHAPNIDHGYWPHVQTGAFASIWDDFTALMETDALRAADARDRNEGLAIEQRLLRGLSSGAHPAGGCAIGRVVSPDLDVLGTDGLYVADASVFPRHVTNNPNLTVHVVGEMAAAKLRPGQPAPAVISQPSAADSLPGS